MRYKAVVVKATLGSGTIDNPYRINLPTYIVIEEITKRDKGKFDKNKPILMRVLVPDDEIDEKTGKLDKAKICKKYKGQPEWDKPDVCDDCVVD